jgi:hypothetical protein
MFSIIFALLLWRVASARRIAFRALAPIPRAASDQNLAIPRA